MLPVATDEFELDPPGGTSRQALRDLAAIALSALVMCAVALILSFVTATSAHAQAAKGELRIGHQKAASRFVL